MIPTPSQLDAELAALPREIEPPADLWPDIARRSRQQAPRTWLLNAAAALALTALVVLLARAAHYGSEATPATAHEGGSATSVNFMIPNAARYQAARASLEATFYERLKLLRPETRTAIEANLQIIHKANDDIRRALASDPSSPLLLQLLTETYQQEFDLYRNVARNTEPTQGRS
jgi:hypothetical protein